MNIIVAVPFDEELGNFIGKKGSDEASITFYNRKLDDNTIVALMPSSLEEKFHALPQCLLMGEQTIVSTKSLDKFFGEVLIACSLLDKPVIFTKDNDISNFLKSVKLEKHEFADMENILNDVIKNKNTANTDDTKRIDIDRAFNVKGIGTVVLGVVTKGTVKVHDTLFHNSGKQVVLRSIQSQDQDVKEAAPGTRVGLALKGIEEDSLGKGDILSSVLPKAGKQIELDVKKSPLVNEPIEVGKTYWIASGFSYSAISIESVEGSKVKGKLEKGITVEINDQFMLVRTLTPRIFAVGKITSIS